MMFVFFFLGFGAVIVLGSLGTAIGPQAAEMKVLDSHSQSAVRMTRNSRTGAGNWLSGLRP